VVAGSWRIEANVHVLAGSRLTDALNSRSKDYMALTDPVVFDAVTGEELYRPPYVAVNRNAILAVFPLE